MQCPGQDSRYWDGEAIFEAKCSKCGHSVEFFKDDSKRKCKKCGHDIFNPKMDFGCASYCPYAEQCLGSMPPELLNKKKNLLIDRIALEMKQYFDGDFKQIGRATRLARKAENIAKAEKGNKAVIMISAYLQYIEAKEPERTDKITEILTKLGANEGLVTEICEIISQLEQTPQVDSATLNFKAVYDAIALANLEERLNNEDPPPALSDYNFLTSSAQEMANSLLA